MQGLDTEILKNGSKKLFENRLCSKKNPIWPWKPNKIRIFVSSPIIGSNWKDIYLFIYLPFHLFVYFITDHVVFFLIASFDIEPVTTLKVVSFRSERLFLFSVVKLKPKQWQQPIRAREVSWGTNEARNLPEAREKRVTKLCLVLVLKLIGRESGANFQDQSKSEVTNDF